MEQKEMSKAYAVDFDGTLCENRWPERIEFFGGDCRKVGADVYIDDRAWNPITGGDISNMAAGERGTCEGLETTEELAGWKKQMMRTDRSGAGDAAARPKC